MGQEAELRLHAMQAPQDGLHGLPPGLLPEAPRCLRSCFAFKGDVSEEAASRCLAALDVIAGAPARV